MLESTGGNKYLEVGVVMRSFASTRDRVEGTVKRVLAALKKIMWYKGDGWNVGNVLVLIPRDDRYKDVDCGYLADEIRAAWQKHLEQGAPESDAVLQILEVHAGDLFVGLQNLAADYLYAKGSHIMVTLAPSAFPYFGLGTADAMMQAFLSGAKVAGVAVPENGLDELVRRGTLGGPIAAYDLQALQEVERFDQAAAQAMVGEEKPNAGVEEIHPLVRIIRRHGVCYASITPTDEVPKRELSGEDLARHEKQVATKTSRQMAHAASLGVDSLQFFADAVMPNYR